MPGLPGLFIRIVNDTYSRIRRTSCSGMKPEIFVKWVLGEITTDYIERIMNKKLDKI